MQSSPFPSKLVQPFLLLSILLVVRAQPNQLPGQKPGPGGLYIGAPMPPRLPVVPPAPLPPPLSPPPGPSPAIRTNDTATGSNDNATCGGGTIGNSICADPVHCCSQYGFCGPTKEYCGDGCLGGPCLVPAPPPRPPGTCGSGVKGNGYCTSPKDCCSKSFWCGSSADHCGDGCVGGNCLNAG
ncbi:hypothetical protein V8C86DRAFT_2475969 [Haematococcus lacustris]